MRSWGFFAVNPFWGFDSILQFSVYHQLLQAYSRQTNSNMAYRNRCPLGSPYGGAGCPVRGRLRGPMWRFSAAMILLRYPLSQPVRLTALPKGEPRGATVSARQITIYLSVSPGKQASRVNEIIVRKSYILFRLISVVSISILMLAEGFLAIIAIRRSTAIWPRACLGT